MDLVVDANILFAALIKRNITSNLLFNNNLSLFAPEFILVEFMKYRDLIRKKTERTNLEFDKLLRVFRKRITLVRLENLYIENARRISPDLKDVPYIALALKLNAAIWSNDKALKEKQDYVMVYSTQDIVKLIH